jgi:hypothetical protein
LFNAIEVFIGFALPLKQSNQNLTFTMLSLIFSRQGISIRHHTVS